VKRDEGVSHNVTVAKNVKSYYPKWIASSSSIVTVSDPSTETLETSLLLGCVVDAWLEVKKKSCFVLSREAQRFLPASEGS